VDDESACAARFALLKVSVSMPFHSLPARRFDSLTDGGPIAGTRYPDGRADRTGRTNPACRSANHIPIIFITAYDE
jgi:hypothetical protein